MNQMVIKDYFEIEPIILNDKNSLNNSDIFILQYPLGNELSFSYGKILSLEEKRIYHSGSTEEGSSGSPIIRRSKNNYIIGLHYGGIIKEKNKEKNKEKEIYSFNLATTFDSILNDINKPNEINCIYKIKYGNQNEIQLLHNYNEDVSEWHDE